MNIIFASTPPSHLQIPTNISNQITFKTSIYQTNPHNALINITTTSHHYFLKIIIISPSYKSPNHALQSMHVISHYMIKSIRWAYASVYGALVITKNVYTYLHIQMTVLNISFWFPIPFLHVDCLRIWSTPF